MARGFIQYWSLAGRIVRMIDGGFVRPLGVEGGEGGREQRSTGIATTGAENRTGVRAGATGSSSSVLVGAENGSMGGGHRTEGGVNGLAMSGVGDPMPPYPMSDGTCEGNGAGV